MVARGDGSWALVVILFGGVGLGACSDRAAAGQAKDDPCSLVTAAEAAGLLGGQAGAPQRVTAGPSRACVYPRAGGEVRIVISPLPDPKAFARDSKGLGAGAEAVAGIGDEAYVLSRAFDAVFFRKGSLQVIISVAEPPGLADTTRDALVAIGKLAAPRL